MRLYLYYSAGFMFHSTEAFNILTFATSLLFKNYFVTQTDLGSLSHTGSGEVWSGRSRRYPTKHLIAVQGRRPTNPSMVRSGGST